VFKSLAGGFWEKKVRLNFQSFSFDRIAAAPQRAFDRPHGM